MWAGLTSFVVAERLRDDLDDRRPERLVFRASHVAATKDRLERYEEERHVRRHQALSMSSARPSSILGPSPNLEVIQERAVHLAEGDLLEDVLV
jgi:2-polyprenyl-6-methoxyphenol hydroxylase-like FAD-dependent oxidoreductase